MGVSIKTFLESSLEGTGQHYSTFYLSKAFQTIVEQDRKYILIILDNYNYRFSKSANNFDFRISYKVLQKENAVVRFGGAPVHMSNRSRSSTSYYNKNIFTDNEQIEGKTKR